MFFMEDIGFCASTAGIWQFAGYAVLILKIIIPAILIIIGVVELGKAVIGGDDKATKTAVNLLIKKFITAVVIFFIPQIVSGLFKAVHGFKEVEADYDICRACIVSPLKDNGKCKKAIAEMDKEE